MRKYAVSACLLIKDENRYLSEWLDWHTRQGVEHFYIYDNGSQVPVEQDIPEQHKNRCTVVDWSGHHWNTQLDAYADCLAKFSAETEWIAFIDTDEFIRVVDGTALPKFLAQDIFETADAVCAGWITYNANGLLRRDDRPVRERFTKAVTYPQNLPQCKCVVRVDRVRMMGPHWPIIVDRQLAILDGNGCVHGGASQPLPMDKLVVDHYFTRSLEEWQEKMARGSCDPNYTRETKWFQMMNPDMADILSEKGGI